MKLKDCKNILKVGMKVKEVRGGGSLCSELLHGAEQIVVKIGYDTVKFGNECKGHSWDSDIELAIIEPSWDNLQVGMKLEDKFGRMRTILEVGPTGKTFLVSYIHNQTSAEGWYTVDEVKNYDWKIKNSSPAPEVIEISGKKYDKAQVEERIKELKPL